MSSVSSGQQLIRILPWAGVLILMFLATGCGPKVSHYLNPDFPQKTPFKIAVLPLTNLSTDESASEIMGGALTVELLGSGGFTLLDPAYTNTAMGQLRIRYADRMSHKQLNDLAAALNVDGVLIGTVNAYEYRMSDGLEYPLISVHASILSLPEGDILWMADACRRGNDREFILGIGLVESLPQLGQDLARSMFSTLPHKVIKP